MTKRIISLLLAALLTLGVFGAVSLAEEKEGETSVYYVYTENGKPLNVRLAPNGEIVGTLASGDEVHVTSFIDGNWAEISFHYDHPEKGEGDWTACVNRRFLITITPDELARLIEAGENEHSGDLMTDISVEFANARKVESYRIMIRPPRVTSWANLRWIPSESGMIITQYPATKELVVLKELKNYLQVQDPETGDVGYIHRKYASR